MLAYLDSLCAALLARNSSEIRRLLALPGAADLPRQVREEAIAIAQRQSSSYRAPVHALHYYYKLSHLVDERSDEPGGTGATKPSVQMELPFRAAGGF